MVPSEMTKILNDKAGINDNNAVANSIYSDLLAKKYDTRRWFEVVEVVAGNEL